MTTTKRRTGLRLRAGFFGLLLPVLLTPLLSAGSGAEAQSAAFPDNEEIAALLRERIEEGRGVGIVVGLREADGSTRVVAVGDAGSGARPLGERSIFEIGSISKAFTGTLLADMARRREVSLADPVTRHLPDDVRIPTRAGREITLFDLATHHSALPRLPGNVDPEDPTNPYADYTVEEMYAFLSGLELERDIGSEYEYSNLGFGLLGHALARTAGVSYETLVGDRILEPLGMDDTGITPDEEMRAWMTRGHDLGGAEVSSWSLPALAGGGALRSSARDMLTFLDANLGESESDLERSMRVAREARRVISTGRGGVGALIGLGWHIRSSDDGRIVWHNGGTGGYRSFLGLDPDREVGVVVLANGAHPQEDIGLHLLNSDLPLAEPPEKRVAVEVDSEILDDYVGEYRLSPELSMEVTLEAGVLHVQPTNQANLPVYPESETEFFVRTVDARLTFRRDETGDVVGVVLHQNGQKLSGRKVQ